MSRGSPAPVRRLGLLGGSFDPVHGGHLHVARAAQQAFELDRVIFVPAARPPHKPGRELAAGHHRLAMVELAIAGEPTWSACDLELRRSGPSFTIDTVRSLPAAVGEPDVSRIHLLIGEDNLPGLPGWRDAEELLARVEPVVVSREGGRERALAAVRGRLPGPLLAKLERGFLGLPSAPGRSTELRTRLAAGADPGTDLPESVRAYIRDHGLYREGPGADPE